MRETFRENKILANLAKSLCRLLIKVKHAQVTNFDVAIMFLTLFAIN